MRDGNDNLLDAYVRQAKSIRLSDGDKRAILDHVREMEREASSLMPIADAQKRQASRPAPRRRAPGKTPVARTPLPHPIPKRRFASVCVAALLACALLAAGAVLAPWGGGTHDMSLTGPFSADAYVAKRPAMRLEVFDASCLEAPKNGGADSPLPACTLKAKLDVPFLSGQLRVHLEGADDAALLPSDTAHWPALITSPQEWVILNRADGYRIAFAEPLGVSQSALDRYSDQGLDQSFVIGAATDIVEQLGKARLIVRDDTKEYTFGFRLPDAVDSAMLRYNVTVADEFLPLSLELELLETSEVEN